MIKTYNECELCFNLHKIITRSDKNNKNYLNLKKNKK